MTEPQQPPQQPQQWPQQPHIIIKQETTTGTKVALWLLVLLLGSPLLCCFGSIILSGPPT